MARARASVDTVTLLKDYMAWEPRKLLRDRARAIEARMERELAVLETGLSEKMA